MGSETKVRAELLFLAFERNSRVNATLLAGLGQRDLPFQVGNAWSILEHLTHLIAARQQWITEVSPAHARNLTPRVTYTEDEQQFDPLLADLDQIADALRQGDAAAQAAVEAALTEARQFSDYYRTDPTDFLIHILVHDAHHRGHIMGLLRQAGRTREELSRLDELSWPVWRE